MYLGIGLFSFIWLGICCSSLLESCFSLSSKIQNFYLSIFPHWYSTWIYLKLNYSLLCTSEYLFHILHLIFTFLVISLCAFSMSWILPSVSMILCFLTHPLNVLFQQPYFNIKFSLYFFQIYLLILDVLLLLSYHWNSTLIFWNIFGHRCSDFCIWKYQCLHTSRV